MSGGVLFVCTGNLCRSPMAEGLLRARLEERGAGIEVASAGFAGEGLGPPPEVVRVMRGDAPATAAHRSRRVDARMVASSGLVVGMTRQHLVDLSLLAPSHWGRCFTFAELVVRGEAAGARRPGEAVAAWAARVGAGRSRAGVLRLDPAGDVRDPMGGSLADYERTRDHLSRLTSRLGALLAPA